MKLNEQKQILYTIGAALLVAGAFKMAIDGKITQADYDAFLKTRIAGTPKEMPLPNHHIIKSSNQPA